jgi:hypothetical protein
MVMLNDLDRFHLVIDVIDRVPGLSNRAGHVRQRMVDSRLRARTYTREHGEDAPDIQGWTWPYGRPEGDSVLGSPGDDPHLAAAGERSVAEIGGQTEGASRAAAQDTAADF